MIGTQIQNYRIERLIGEGGMGNVYLGVHTHIGRQVAIKALNPNLARNPEIRERFKNEASMLSQLHHPNIVTLYDYVEMDTGVFLIMEYAEGQPLDHYIENTTGPIPEEKAILLFTQILDGVAYAHKKNVVHRDIKPSNIIVKSDGKVKILDFGIAKIIGDTNNKLTKTGTKLGTVLYMSPEQVKGLPVDFHTDIYSLGITLFEMLTGRCPFNSNSTEYEVYKKIVEETLPDARTFYPGVTERMMRIIKKATEKDMNERFQSCSEFKQYISGALNFENVSSQKNSKSSKKESKAKSKKTEKPVKPWHKKSMLFWNIFMTSFLITAIIITGFKLLNIKEERYVLAGQLLLRNSKSVDNDANALKTIDFGSPIEILDTDDDPDDNGLRWAKVREAGGKEGYVAMNYLGTKKEFDQIKNIFTDESQSQTNVVFKKAVRNYLVSKFYFDDDGNPEWRVYAENGKPEYNYFTSGDFNDDGLADYACMISSIRQDVYRLIVFTGKGKDDTYLIHDEEYFSESLLSTKKKGEKISTGKFKSGFEYDEEGTLVQTQKKVYEPLASDALILKNKKDGKRYMYLFNIGENTFNQSFEMK